MFNVRSRALRHALFDVKSGKVRKNVPAMMKLIIGGAKDLQTYKISIKENQISSARMAMLLAVIVYRRKRGMKAISV